MSEKPSFFNIFKIGSKKEIDINALYEQAVELLKNKDITNSKAKFLEILEIEPDNKNSIINLSKIYNYENNFTESINILKKYLENNPNSFDIKIRLATSYMKNLDFESSIGLLNQLKNSTTEEEETKKVIETLIKVYTSQIENFKKDKKYKEAIYTYEDIYKLNNDKHLYYFNLALTYMEIKNYSKAREYFNYLMQDEKTSKQYMSDTYYYMGKIEEIEGKDHKAVLLYEEYIDKYNFKEYNQYFKGKIDLFNKRFNESIKEFISSIQNKKYIYDSYINLGQCYIGLKQYSKALETFNKSLEISKNAQNILLSVFCLLKLNEIEKALVKIKRLNEKVFLKHPDISKDIAITLFDLNLTEESINILNIIKNKLINDIEIGVYFAKYNKLKRNIDEYISEIINLYNLYPHNYAVMKEYAEYLKDINTFEALNIYDKMLQIWIKNKEPLRLKADIFESQNNNKEFVKALEEYLTFEDNPEYTYKLGIAYFNNINMDKAVTVLNKIKNNKKYGFEINSLLSNIYVSKGDTINAAECLERCIDLAPANIESYIKYAKLLFKNGKSAKAVSFLNHALKIEPDNKDIKALLTSYS